MTRQDRGPSWDMKEKKRSLSPTRSSIGDKQTGLLHLVARGEASSLVPVAALSEISLSALTSASERLGSQQVTSARADGDGEGQLEVGAGGDGQGGQGSKP